MTRRAWACALCLSITAAYAAPMGGQSCIQWSQPQHIYPEAQYDYAQHTGSQPSYHAATETFEGSCLYDDEEGTEQCHSLCRATVIGDVVDLGTTGGYWHEPAYSTTAGQAEATGTPSTCGGQVAAAVRTCSVAYFLIFGCAVTVTISGSSNGIGGSVSYSITPLWEHTQTYSNTCPMHTRPVLTSSMCQPTIPPANTLDSFYVWDTGSCSWVEECINPDDTMGDCGGFRTGPAVAKGQPIL